ncbi:MAG: flagellar biosynthetic protein FliO [Collimonas sp.]|uniref:flagellar biosynthetic protein FliO n=1 Tax=Collimonas sp. TaxID=1963772 RepID=UPI0032632F96
MVDQILRGLSGGSRTVAACAVAGILPVPAWAQASAAASVSALPFKQDGAGAAFPAGGSILLCVLLLALLLCCIYAAWRRKGGDASKARWMAWLPAPSGNAELKVVASVRLAGRTSLHVIEWEGGKLLVSCGDEGVVRLAAMPSGAETSEQEPVAGDAS